MTWRRNICEHWGTIHFGPLEVSSAGDAHEFRLEVDMDEKVRDNVSVELYAEPIDDGRPVRISMRPGIALADKKAGNIYRARVEDGRSASDYTVRIVPSKAETLVPLEANLIAWHQ